MNMKGIYNHKLFLGAVIPKKQMSWNSIISQKILLKSNKNYEWKNLKIFIYVVLLLIFLAPQVNLSWRQLGHFKNLNV